MLSRIFQPSSQFVMRLGLSIVFFYFGILAVIEPAIQAAAWIAQPFYGWIEAIIPVTIFMTIFGVVQLAVAVGVLFKIQARYAFLLAGFLMLGIIVNLTLSTGFFNDLVMRDLAIAGLAFGLFLDDLGK